MQRSILQDTHSYIKYQPGILEDAWFFIISCIAMLYHQFSPTFSLEVLPMKVEAFVPFILTGNNRYQKKEQEH